MNQFEIYSDGGAQPNPGKGGWAVVILQDGQVKQELSGAEPDTSNNRMELTAAIQGLMAVDPTDKVIFYTDSNYVRQGITLWIRSWKTNGWRTAAKKPVKNQDLWQRLDELASQRSIDWRWVKGHAGNEWNEYVDRLVAQARDSLI